MKNNKKKISISLKAIFIIWLLIYYIVSVNKILIDDVVSFSDLGVTDKIMHIVVAMLFAIIPTVINNWWILGLILLIKTINKKVKKENLTKIDFKQYEGYYREILDGYSPAEIEYIDNLKCDTKVSIVATLLKLELLGKVIIEKDNIIVIDANIDGLKQTEKYVLESIENGKVKIKYSANIEKYTKDEAIEDNLIKKFKFENSKNSIKKRRITMIIVFLLFALMCNFVECINNIENTFFKTLLSIIVFGIMLGLPYMIFMHPIKSIIYRIIKGNSYLRTEKGIELNEKIEGLKNYIIQYSTIETKDKEELALWEDYLIYSVIFKQNTKIIEEISKLIEIEYEIGKIYFSR